LTAVEWDTSVVRTATEAVIAADDRNRILAASPAAFDLLGWDDDLVGRRIVAVIPERFREAHIAAFTLHLLTGETRILDREVAVPALRRDGTEVAVRLLVQRDSAAEGHTVFLATLRTP
jgi:PAS domain S-box-containing protein